MITGDHLLIGLETAKQLGMRHFGGGELQFQGDEYLAALDSNQSTLHDVPLDELTIQADGFAGVAPKHKYRVVETLQRLHHVVAMTGDGVNDAPALHRANVGIAVHGATDAAKAAADLVLLDSGISVIADAVTFSRAVFARIKSYVTYRVSATLEFLLFFVLSTIFLGFTLPALSLVVITLLNDFVSVSIAYGELKKSIKVVFHSFVLLMFKYK